MHILSICNSLQRLLRILKHFALWQSNFDSTCKSLEVHALETSSLQDMYPQLSIRAHLVSGDRYTLSKISLFKQMPPHPDCRIQKFPGMRFILLLLMVIDKSLMVLTCLSAASILGTWFVLLVRWLSLFRRRFNYFERTFWTLNNLWNLGLLVGIPRNTNFLISFGNKFRNILQTFLKNIHELRNCLPKCLSTSLIFHY